MKAKVTRNIKATTNNGKNNAMEYRISSSPVGELLLVTDGKALTGLYFVGCDHLPAASKNWKLNPKHAILQLAEKQLQEYFAGERQDFSIPISFAGTAFQASVWREIARIPFGETVSYSNLARRAGKPAAIRAAGTSTGRNPISIIVPCHRVVGKNGSLHGFAGGLERKRHLLGLENAELELMKVKNRR